MNLPHARQMKPEEEFRFTEVLYVSLLPIEEVENNPFCCNYRGSITIHLWSNVTVALAHTYVPSHYW